MKILCLHGVGHKDSEDPNFDDRYWRQDWERTITSGLRQWNANAAPQFSFPSFDQRFEQAELKTSTVLAALAELIRSGLFHGFADIFRNRRGMGDMMDAVRWTSGMVAQWVALDTLRRDLRQQIGAEILAFQPDVILAHSLGSLILYDTLKQDEANGGALSSGRTIITLGSQIGNAAVRGTFGGRIEELQAAAWWWHLYNEEDDVFTCPISPATTNHFQQVDTPFDIDGFADHEATEYLKHEETSIQVWQALGTASRSLGRKPYVMRKTPRDAMKTMGEKPQMRALLVGVAEYPDAENSLGGPVNDVFLMSSVLQEIGFPADNIRVVLNNRATTQGIRERLKWLLEDSRSGDTLFFFFAGHGAQIPGYGRDAEVDRVDECLVPYDFDWRTGNAITDDEFAALYGQLPYDVQFTVVLDCCHAGGMARSGGARVRGLTPPDDIRHRLIHWDRDTQMWLPRKKLMEVGENRAARFITRKSDLVPMLGEHGFTNRLGRAASLWSDKRDYTARKKAFNHFGPYTPILLEACRENEFAYEYSHGAISYGAFTYSLCETVRRAAQQNRDRVKAGQPTQALTFSELGEQVARRIRSVVAEPQTPQMVGPKVWTDTAVPGV